MAFPHIHIIDECRRMKASPIQQTLQGVYEHIEDDDPQPTQVLVTPGNITMTMKSIDDLLDWTDTVQEHEDVTFVAQLLWKQAEDQPAPTVITASYGWEFDDHSYATIRVYSSSPLTMDQLSDATMDDRIEVTRSQVETLMLQGHAAKAGL